METKQVIVMRTDLKNTHGKPVNTGKLIAQGAHASLGVFTQMFEYKDGYIKMNINEDIIEWLDNSFVKICLGIDSQDNLIKLLNKVKDYPKNIPYKLIVDNGTTEFGGIPTVTCLAIGPADATLIDMFTGHLKLFK